MINWVKNFVQVFNKNPRRAEIINQAYEFSKQIKKPSKGWCDKFMKRNKEIFLKSSNQNLHMRHPIPTTNSVTSNRPVKNEKESFSSVRSDGVHHR